MPREATHTAYLRRRITSRSSRPLLRYGEQQTSKVQQPGVPAVVPAKTLVQLRGLCLVCDSSSSSYSSLRVAEVGMADRLEVLVQLVHERDARRDVQFDDVVITDAVEVLYEGADRVAVRDDDDLSAGLHRGRDRLLPIGNETCHRVPEALGQRQLVFRHVGIAGIMSRPAVIGFQQSGRLSDVAAPPQFDLGITVFLRRLSLVESLQGSVVTFVEPPAADLRDPHEVHLVEGDPQRANVPLEDRDVRQVEGEPTLLQELACVVRLGDPLLGQVDVGPASKPVLFVPCAFTVPEQYYFVHMSPPSE